MDQDIFFDVKPFDRSKVDFTKTATTVEAFMQRVIVERDQCPEVMVASVDNLPIMQRRSQNALVPEERSKNCVCPHAPGKSDYFAARRMSLEKLKPIRNERMSKLVLPSLNNKEEWCKLCFEERVKNFYMSPETEKRFAHHAGTPPTLSFVKHLSENQINQLILYQIEYAVEHGFSRPVLQWIFALMLMVKKPLLHDVCHALRELARSCRIWRADFDETHMAEIYECSAIIAIVSVFFGQKDLSDD